VRHAHDIDNGFTDNTPGAAIIAAGTTYADPTTAVHAEIDRMYRNRLALVNSGDMAGSITAYASPDFTFTEPTITVRRAGQSVPRTYTDPNPRAVPLAEVVKGIPPMTIRSASLDIESYQANAEQAAVTFRMRADIDRPSIGGDVEEATYVDDWRKRDGRWLIVSERRLTNIPSRAEGQ
jgi:hypothetical protein